MLQLLPFQRSITGRWMGGVPVSARPTAQALPGERVGAPEDVGEWVRLGLDTAVQVAAAAGVASASSATAEQGRPSGEVGTGPTWARMTAWLP